MTGRVRGWGLVVAGGAFMLVAASAAWACTATTIIRLTPTEAAMPGEQVGVLVYATALASGPVEIRMIDAPPASAPLAAATITQGQAVTLPVTVPDLAPGVHYLGLMSHNQFVARAALQVLSPEAAAGAEPAPSVRSDAGQAHGGSMLPLVMTSGIAAVAALGGLSLVVTKRRRVRADLPA